MNKGAYSRHLCSLSVKCSSWIYGAEVCYSGADRVFFRVYVPYAKKVSLRGIHVIAGEVSASLTAEGSEWWSIQLDLPPGEIQYMFVVDNRAELSLLDPDVGWKERDNQIWSVRNGNQQDDLLPPANVELHSLKFCKGFTEDQNGRPVMVQPTRVFSNYDAQILCACVMGISRSAVVTDIWYSEKADMIVSIGSVVVLADSPIVRTGIFGLVVKAQATIPTGTFRVAVLCGGRPLSVDESIEIRDYSPATYGPTRRF